MDIFVLTILPYSSREYGFSVYSDIWSEFRPEEPGASSVHPINRNEIIRT
jgi:hypothetical protein